MQVSRKEGSTVKSNTFKTYETPAAEVMTVSAADILTFSAGFEGEEHDFLLPLA